MPDVTPTRALTVRSGPPLSRGAITYSQVDLQAVAQHLYALMLRNVATEGFTFSDSGRAVVSRPGCVIAAPSYPGQTPGISQDYVFNWTRDAAITALEVAAATSPDPDSTADPDSTVQTLNDYVAFAQVCWENAAPSKGHACFRIDGVARPWTENPESRAYVSAEDVRRIAEKCGLSIVKQQVIDWSRAKLDCITVLKNR